MILQTPEQQLKKARVDFRIDEFRRLIKQKGMRLDWVQTINCPCTNQTSTDFSLDLTGVSDINADASGNNVSCPVCQGKGLVSHSRQEILAIVADSSKEEGVSKKGLHYTGKVKITLEPEHLPSWGDKFILKDSVVVQREIVTMPSGDTVTLTYPVVNRLLNLQNGSTEVGILYIQQSDLSGLGIDSATIPEHTILPDGSIQFTNELTKPQAGTKISISYYTNPVYVVTEFPHTFRDTFLLENNVQSFSNMPVQIFAKQEV